MVLWTAWGHIEGLALLRDCQTVKKKRYLDEERTGIF
jgi:hypothetical protein